MSYNYICIYRATQLDYEDASVLLLPIGISSGNKNSEGDDDDDEYIIYSNL